MTSEHPGGSYNGFSGQGFSRPGGPDTGLRIERPAANHEPRPEARQFEPHEYRLPQPRRGVSRGMLLGGVGVALGLGLLFGVFAKPDFGADGRDRGPMQPVTRTAEDTVSTPVPVEVAAVAPTPPPKSAGKLDVLPPDLARAAEANASIAAARAPAPRPQPRPAPTLEAPAPAPREIAPAPRFAEAPAPAMARPSFDCRYAGTRAERMVCGDAELARLDRQLDRAFDRAVSSGIPYRALRAEQDDWLSIREQAARRSPEAVESIYRQRIAELDDLSR